MATILCASKKVSEARGPTGGQGAEHNIPRQQGGRVLSCLGANNYTTRHEFPVQVSAEVQFILASTP